MEYAPNESKSSPFGTYIYITNNIYNELPAATRGKQRAKKRRTAFCNSKGRFELLLVT